VAVKRWSRTSNAMIPFGERAGSIEYLYQADELMNMDDSLAMHHLPQTQKSHLLAQVPIGAQAYGW
jgi:hypothetical protein